MNIGTKEDLSVLKFRKGGSTRYFTSGLFDVGLTTLAILANRLYGVPFFVAEPEKFDRMAIRITTAGASGTKARLGIYADSGLAAPGRLILDAGEVAVDAIAVVEIVISLELIRNLYWLSMISNGTPTIRELSLGSLYTSPLGMPSGLPTGWYIGFSMDATYGALPDPFGAAAVYSGTQIPTIFLRKI